MTNYTFIMKGYFMNGFMQWNMEVAADNVRKAYKQALLNCDPNGEFQNWPMLGSLWSEKDQARYTAELK